MRSTVSCCTWSARAIASSLSEAQKRALLSNAGATTITSMSSPPLPIAAFSVSPETGSATRASTFRPIV
jgi:hypothetical protein